MSSVTQENLSSRLPVETWGEILSWAGARTELHVVHQREHTGSRSHSPWDLALVCRDWRDAVFSTPCIWSDISLKVIPDPKQEMANHQYDALKLCLDRSRSHPLTIEFMTSKIQPSNQNLVFMKLLMEHVQRWDTVTICASLDTLLPYLSSYPVQFTRLRCLRLDNSLQKAKKDYVGLFQDAPLLSYISLDHLPYYGQRLGEVGIPWFQITHLQISIYFGTLDDLMNILKYTSNLVALDYNITYNYFGQGGQPILELSHLQRLTWASNYERGDDADGPATSQFFDLLKVPQLLVLGIYGVFHKGEEEALRGCIQRSGCSITSLDLPTSHLSSLLRLTPDVKTLGFTTKPNLDGNSSLCGLELAHLQEIVCRNYPAEDGDTIDPAASQFFESLKAPQLSVLEVDGVCRDRELEAISSCLQRSRCLIKSLKLSTRHLPSLRNLTLGVEILVLPSSSKEDLMSLFKELTFDHSAVSWLFPKLKKIVLNFDIAAGPLFNALIGMLKSRLWAPPNSSVRLRCNKLRELELGEFVSKYMKHWVQKRLKPQESLVITYKEWRPGPHWRWTFCE